MKKSGSDGRACEGSYFDRALQIGRTNIEQDREVGDSWHWIYGRVHLETLCRLGSIEICGIASADPQRAHRLAAEFGIEGIETDYRRILEDPDVEVIHVCTPTALHAQNVKEALQAGKHVLSEKPLAVSAAEAHELVELAKTKRLRNCTNQNLRYYPLVQHMRALREAGELGEILVVHGSYAQDYLLFDTDWNWRLDATESGPSCAMADIGSHWCDMTEFVTGLPITRLCADLNTFHPTRKRPKDRVETFAGKLLLPEDYEQVPVDNEDYGAVLLHMGERGRGSFTAGQVFAGRKNRLNIEIYGSKASLAWNQERPEELWIGNRNSNNQNLIKDASLIMPGARRYAHMPGGHAEGYEDTFKNLFRRFYESVQDPSLVPDYPQFADGLRQLTIIEAELASNRKQGWVDVATAP